MQTSVFRSDMLGREAVTMFPSHPWQQLPEVPDLAQWLRSKEAAASTDVLKRSTQASEEAFK